MSPRARQFTESEIATTALDLIRENGWNALTARSIAKRLGTSTSPIYSVFVSMVEIETAVRIEAMDSMLRSMLTPRSDNPLLDLALGYVAYARDEPLIFRFLYIDRPKEISIAERNGLEGRGLTDRLRAMFEDPSDDPLDTYFGGQSVDATDDIAFRAWIFTHGLAMLLCSNMLPGADDAELRRLLEGAGFAFHLLQQQKATP